MQQGSLLNFLWGGGIACQGRGLKPIHYFRGNYNKKLLVKYTGNSSLTQLPDFTGEWIPAN